MASYESRSSITSGSRLASHRRSQHSVLTDALVVNNNTTEHKRSMEEKNTEEKLGMSESPSKLSLSSTGSLISVLTCGRTKRASLQVSGCN